MRRILFASLLLLLPCSLQAQLTTGNLLVMITDTRGESAAFSTSRPAATT